jgi:hypothetical protein
VSHHNLQRHVLPPSWEGDFDRLLLYTELPIPTLAKTAERLNIKRHGADDLRERVEKPIGCTTRVEMVHDVLTKGMRLS